MPTTRQGANVVMTLEAVQAMIDQTLLRNNTTDDGSQNSGGGPRRPMQPARVCSYTDFMKCQPLNFKGTEGIVGLSQWVEKIESVFHISGCAVENQVKFATCTLLGAALTWWNGHVRTLGHDAAYAMTWEILKKKLTDKYCLKGEIKKLEIELWNLKVKGNDVGCYTQLFQELALMCTKFISNETEKVDKYISGLPDNIHGNVMAARPKTLDDAIELANDLMDQKLRTYAERQTENKRKLDNNNRLNNNFSRNKMWFKFMLIMPTTRQGANVSMTLKVKGNDVGGYTQRFQELALMCTKFISNESEKVDKYISGLPDNIHGNVMAARPKTLDDAIELANDLMDHKLRTYAERQAENKRKLDNDHQA
nr:reverse transcriptase domain-containing protein [Tanacetum cinerariifolium]